MVRVECMGQVNVTFEQLLLFINELLTVIGLLSRLAFMMCRRCLLCGLRGVFLLFFSPDLLGLELNLREPT